MSFIKNLKYSINKRLKFYHQARIWAKYGNETRFHFDHSDIEIGEFTYGIPEIKFYDLGTKLKIGKFCSIAEGVKFLLGGGHPIYEVSQYPFDRCKNIFSESNRYLPNKSYDIIIGNDVWLGKDTLVLSGVTIGDGAIIGAGAVVSKDIPPYAVAVGNPIRIIKYRTTPENIETLLKIKWWDFPIDKINKLIPYMKDVNLFVSVCYNSKWGG